MSNAPTKVILARPALALQLDGNAKDIAKFATQVADIKTRAGGGWVKIYGPGGFEQTVHVGDWVVIQNEILFVYSDSEFAYHFKPSRAK